MIIFVAVFMARAPSAVISDRWHDSPVARVIYSLQAHLRFSGDGAVVDAHSHSISPVNILFTPITNCNKRFFFANHLIKTHISTYQKSRKIELEKDAFFSFTWTM